MIYDVTIGALVLLNICLILLIDRSGKRHDAQVDSLTAKIMAPTFNEYEAARPKIQIGVPGKKVRGENRGRAITESNMVPIDEADREEVMLGIARQLGREDEYIEEG